MSSPLKTTTSLSIITDEITGKKRVNQYSILKQIGRGVHGKVKLAQDQDGKLFAIKIIDKKQRKTFTNRAPLDKIKKEIAIMQKCNHVNVVELHEAEKIYLILDYLAGGDIKWNNGNDRPLLNEGEARRIFRDVVCGVMYLHHQGIVHRDIKPANLLWTNLDPQTRRVKISDFGVSVITRGQDSADNDQLLKTAGSPAFFAPELCGGDDDDLVFAAFRGSSSPPTPKPFKRPVKIGTPIDVWAIGVTLFCIVFGRVPFIAALAHPWTCADLDSHQRDQWIKETESSFGEQITVTDEEVRGAVTVYTKIRNKIRKLSRSFQNLAGFRKRDSDLRGSPEGIEHRTRSLEDSTELRGTLEDSSGDEDDPQRQLAERWFD